MRASLKLSRKGKFDWNHITKPNTPSPAHVLVRKVFILRRNIVCGGSGGCHVAFFFHYLSWPSAQYGWWGQGKLHQRLLPFGLAEEAWKFGEHSVATISYYIQMAVMTWYEHHMMWILWLLTSTWYNGTYMHLSGFTPTSDEVLYEQLLTTISSSWTFLFVFATPARVQQSFIRNIDIGANTAKGKWYKQKLLAQGQDSKYSPSCPSKQSEEPPNLTWEHAWRRTDVGLCMKISNLCRLQWMPQGSSTTTATISAGKTSGSL